MTYDDKLQEYESYSDNLLVYVMANEIRGKVGLGISAWEWLLKEGTYVSKEQEEMLQIIKYSYDEISLILELAMQSRHLHSEK